MDSERTASADGSADAGGDSPDGAADESRPSDADPLLVWCLASFHASFLVLVPIWLVHVVAPRALGDLLGGLDTAVGLALYAVLWGATWWTNRRWLAECDLADARRTLLSGAKWGAPTGIALLAALAVVVFVETNGIFALLVLVVGVVVAALVGALVGSLFAALDLVVIRAVDGAIENTVTGR